MIVSRNALLFLIVLAVCICGTLFYQKTGGYIEVLTFPRNVSNFEDITKALESIANKKGALYAYEVLRRVPLPQGTDLHLLAHTVGNILYKQQGPAGMQWCTQDFRNACSHAIVVGALLDKGEEALVEIREACKKAPGGNGAYFMCYHGLGHGILAFTKYDLPATIALCKKTGLKENNNQEYSQCVGGAIMELMGTGGHAPDQLDRARTKYLTSPLAPCFASFMPLEVRSSCMVYITPEIWSKVGIERGNPNSALFPKAFKICDSIPASDGHRYPVAVGNGGFLLEWAIQMAANPNPPLVSSIR